MTMEAEPGIDLPRGPRSKEQFALDLVKAARRMFLERGVAATSMADVGHALRVSKPTVYEAFESKQALVDAVFASAVKDVDLSWIANAARGSVKFSGFLDQARDVYKASLRVPKGLEVFQLVIREGSRSSELLSAFSQYMVLPSVPPVRSLVARAIERGECREMELKVVQKLIVSPMYFLMSDRAMFGSEAMSIDSADAYLDAYFAGLKALLCPADQMQNG